ncbi:hypothetical protein JNUCC1_00908 [Lentibacillus sp. JNUCC-1]|uniref:nucleotide exchange factor GrpE n=1 Tax=Lentibacillus sp. JNUCC-1 TaxID=2654513 RepID=UPI0012E8EB45|nr:nucleotide exchange factor GrpE [Lentibacillus sp. JNUCC-1]MUV37102.1 hypothetical protein [Lentibacillus sp. JNUCC-1]
MAWFFGKKEKAPDPVIDEINALKQQSHTTEDKLTSLEQHMQKLTRLQYKTSKSMEDKLDHLVAKQTKQQSKTSDHTTQHQLVSHLISQIDDMDMVYNQLSNDPQWAGLLEKWIESSLKTLATIGITETIQIGNTFDPSRAEAVETIPPTGQHQPFEISAIHKRGFAYADGSIYRKAQVTTVKEEDKS